RDEQDPRRPRRRALPPDHPEDRHPLQPAEGVLPHLRRLPPAGRRLRGLERGRARQDPDGLGPAHPARGGGLPLRPHLGPDRGGSRPGVIFRRAKRDAWLLLLLAVLPAIAYAPAWTAGRLLGPGDGAALHFPLRARVWEAYARGDLAEWNP